MSTDPNLHWAISAEMIPSGHPPACGRWHRLPCDCGLLDAQLASAARMGWQPMYLRPWDGTSDPRQPGVWLAPDGSHHATLPAEDLDWQPVPAAAITPGLTWDDDAGEATVNWVVGIACACGQEIVLEREAGTELCPCGLIYRTPAPYQAEVARLRPPR